MCDSQSCSDFKAINQSAVNLFQCGHLQQVKVLKLSERLWIQAHCLPEMKKDRTYKVQLSLSVSGWDIIGANCECPAGQGPAATCEVGTIPQFFTCTQRIQEWNKPRDKKLSPTTVTDLKEHKIHANAVNLNRRESSRTPNNFNP